MRELARDGNDENISYKPEVWYIGTNRMSRFLRLGPPVHEEDTPAAVMTGYQAAWDEFCTKVDSLKGVSGLVYVVYLPEANTKQIRTVPGAGKPGLRNKTRG